jgi:hypothetical protein
VELPAVLAAFPAKEPQVAVVASTPQKTPV